MAITLKNTKDTGNTKVKILVHSISGGGKTTLIKTAPKPIVLSAEAGLLPLQGLDIPFLEIHNLEELYEAYEYVQQNIEHYETIVLDSISEIAEVVLTAEKEKVKDARQAYGALNDSISTLVRAFRDLPLHVYMTAKQERIQDDAGKTFYGPSAPSTRIAQGLPYFFDEVFALRVEKNPETGIYERWLQTSTDGVYTAKDRSGKLNDYELPDLGTIINKITGVIA